MLVVTKFGGSSLADAKQFAKVKQIMEAKQTRQMIVVSAMGKRNKEDSKLTDLLFLLHAHIMYSIPFDSVFSMIQERFIEVKKALGLTYDIEKELEDLKKQFNKSMSVDYLVSRGEYYTGKLMAEYLGFTFVDAKDLITFNYNGTIHQELTEEKIQKAYHAGDKILIPGFYGAYPNGEIKLLARGGSDITGSIVAKALNAELYENWTDVSGILMADPKIIEHPKRINEITYDELRELSYMGANVLHEETVFPVQEMNIPINILNTNDATNPGTIITNHCTDASQVITGISGKKNFYSFTITKENTANKTSIMKNTLEIFEKHNVHVEHIPSSIDSFSVIVNMEEVRKIQYDIIADLKQIPNIKDVTMDTDLALVAVVGRNMVNQAGISGKIFALVGNVGISIKMIAQGSQELAIIFGVSNQEMENAIRVVYQNMVS